MLPFIRAKPAISYGRSNFFSDLKIDTVHTVKIKHHRRRCESRRNNKKLAYYMYLVYRDMNIQVCISACKQHPLNMIKIRIGLMTGILKSTETQSVVALQVFSHNKEHYII